MAKKKTRLQKFGETVYSKDKEYLNAVITSDVTYHPQKKRWHSTFRPLMWLYVAIIFLVTSASLGMLAIDTPTQKEYATVISIVEGVVFIVLVLDLVLRWYTSEVRMKKGNWSYFLFPFTITGIMLIASLLPSMYLFNIWTGQDIKVFKTFEAMKFLRIFRIVLLANLVPGLNLFRRVMNKEKSTLYTVFGLVLIAIVLFSLVIFNIEQEQNKNINSFFDALYFSTVTLTTIGFGDISPVTDTGRVVVMVMAILGVAILAIPSGVIAGGFISELKIVRKEREESKAKKASMKASKKK